MIRVAMLFFVVTACGGGSKSEPVKPAPAASGDMKSEHENMPPELKQFHDVLAPRYHAAKGPERMKSTCDAIPDFTAAATSIAKATPPAGTDPGAWTDAAGKLAASIETLSATCKANDATKFDADFETLHASFHGLMESGGGEHHEM